MDTNYSLKNEVMEINRDIASLFSLAKTIPGIDDHSFGDWGKTSTDIEKQLSEEVIRVAVVGPIKSGKSTFINSLLKNDYLKRGAGVVTSIVTRLRSGQSLKAKLFFKSFDEVNREMEDAMILLPSLNWKPDSGGFDVQKDQDRAALEHVLESLSTEHLFSSDTRNMNAVLLSSYLKGYQRVKDILSSGLFVREYEGNLIGAHKDFVGDDTLSVYLKDLQIDIDKGIDENIEIADCQGSDSSNPLHLAMIQDYLFLTHLIIYVISSRTGVRQADIKFLSIIRKMGIIDNLLFVINFDFNEHESVDDLNALIEKIKEELSMIKPDLEIYVLSALFNLFKSRQDSLSSKDSQRFAQWEKEQSFSELSDGETKRFEADFNRKLTMERYALLLKNHVERLAVIASGMEHWISIHRGLVEQDAGSIAAMLEHIHVHQQKVNQIKAIIKNTLDGSVQQIIAELRKEIDRFFDAETSEVLRNVIEFIRNYSLRIDSYEEHLNTSSFSNTLYLVFQEFKQAIDTFMAESVHPETIHFIRGQEKKIRQHFESISGTYDSMVQDVFSEYKTLSNFGIPAFDTAQNKFELPDTDIIKRNLGITLPPASASMRYSARIKTEAIMRLGFYSILSLIKRVFKKTELRKKEEKRKALKDGVSRMKYETEKAVLFHFKDYRENIKFQYIFKLVEGVSNTLYESMLSRFQGYAIDLSAIMERIGENRLDKEQASNVFQQMELNLKQIHERINRLREQINQNSRLG